MPTIYVDKEDTTASSVVPTLPPYYANRSATEISYLLSMYPLCASRRSEADIVMGD